MILKILLLFLLLVFPAYAQDLAWLSPAMQGGSTPAGCTPSTNACQNATTGECGTTYLACEDFDGSVYCVGSSGAQNCRVTWATYDTIPNWADTAITGEGTYSATLVNDATRAFYKQWTDADAIYVFYKLKTATLTHDTEGSTSRILDNGYTTTVSILNIEVNASHSAQDWKLTCNGGTSATNVAPTPADNTIYYVWHEVVKGANNTCRVFISTTAAKPETATIEITDGTADQVGIVEIREVATTGHTFSVDHIRISATAMSGVPD